MRVYERAAGGAEPVSKNVYGPPLGSHDLSARGYVKEFGFSAMEGWEAQI
jgi:hypothetical protein